MLAVIAPDLSPGSPGRHLLERFSVGYPLSTGGFRARPFPTVRVHGPWPTQESDLVVARDLRTALAGVSAAVVVPGPPLLEVLGLLRPESRVFVYGAIADTLAEARRIADLAQGRRIALRAGTWATSGWRLPPLTPPPPDSIGEALLVTHGQDGELLATDALLGLIGARGVRRVRSLRGAGVFSWLEAQPATKRLLAAALSRSDTPQGDALVDGRTQDLLAPGLLPRLAREPVAHVIDHVQGLRSTVLRLDGAIADLEFAVRTRADSVLAAQILRAPPPSAHHFSRLAEDIAPFLEGTRGGATLDKAILAAGLMETFRLAPGRWHATPELADQSQKRT